MKSLLPRLAWASAGLAVACGLASRATAQDSAPLPCPEPCPPARTVCAPTPKVIVEVPPPNVIIRAAAPCAPECKETLFQKICHFSCHPHHRSAPMQYVQPAAPMQYVQPAPVQYMQAPVQYVQPAPVQMMQAPVQYVQPAPVQYMQAAPVQMMQAPTQFVQAAPMQFMQAAPTQFMVAAPGNFQVNSNNESKADAKAQGETCDAALKKVASQMETLTKVVEAHTQVLVSHEERLQRLEAWAASASGKAVVPPLPELPKR
ncbi:polyadenylate binding domain-containing protein [Urbifossiella limnaea]|uniref:Uncharacterized protein n=1 Tax=Urbifossiella limnaea TaxID=2528023 RepID=A0A517Y3Q3_9BACT|nr:hypothetical protein [Urbifossiella limnaea]QDU24314.1 hypothetical protein ETAA1_63280 [Urbifossiella limnaea]